MKITITDQIVYENQDRLRNKSYPWGRNHLKLYNEYQIHMGTLESGEVVELKKLVKTNISLQDQSGKKIIKPKKYFDKFQIFPEYNCFAYCFGITDYWISSPLELMRAKLVEVDDESKADIITFEGFEGYNDDGENVFNPIHMAKILENGNFSAKNGINGLLENVDFDTLIEGYNFNHNKYYKWK